MPESTAHLAWSLLQPDRFGSGRVLPITGSGDDGAKDSAHADNLEALRGLLLRRAEPSPEPPWTTARLVRRNIPHIHSIPRCSEYW